MFDETTKGTVLTSSDVALLIGHTYWVTAKRNKTFFTKSSLPAQI